MWRAVAVPWWLVLVLVLVGFGLVWFGCLVGFGFGCGLRQGVKEQNTMKSNTFASPHGASKICYRRVFFLEVCRFMLKFQKNEYLAVVSIVYL